MGLEDWGAAIWLPAFVGSMVALAVLSLQPSRRNRSRARTHEDVIVIPEAEPSADDAIEESLLRALRDRDPLVRMAAIGALIGHPRADVIVQGALRDDFPMVRRQAVRALAEIGGPRAAHAVSEVVRSDPAAEVREEAVAAVARMLERRLAGRLLESRTS